MIKQCFIDTETTGLNTQTCGVWNIGGILRIPDEQMTPFDLKCDIFEDDEISEQALETGHIDLKAIAKYQDPAEAYEHLVQIFGNYVDKFNKNDKMYFIGYGAEFDYKVLRRWFEGFGDKYFGSWFWMPWIDVMSLAAHDVMMRGERPKLENFKLVTVLKHYGIPYEEDKLHGARYDADCTMQLFDAIMAGRRGMTSPTETNSRGQKAYRLRK